MIQFTNISGIINQAIDTDIGSVGMPDGKYAKGMIIQTRSGDPFRICSGSAGSEYFTVGSGVSISVPLSSTPGKSVLWARTEAGNDTLEIILFNT